MGDIHDVRSGSQSHRFGGGQERPNINHPLVSTEINRFGEPPVKPDEPPIVFQCAQCNVVVGDSTSWTCTDDISRTITLKNISEKFVEYKEMITSNTGFDAGSTYIKIICDTCQEEVGRKYRCTSTHLDPVREMYTLFVDKLSSYQIGSCEKNRKISRTTDMTDILSIAQVKKMNMQLTKLQSVVTELNERIRYLEQGCIEDDDVRSDTGASCRSTTQPVLSNSVNKNVSEFKIPPSMQVMGKHYPESVHSSYSHLEQLQKSTYLHGRRPLFKEFSDNSQNEYSFGESRLGAGQIRFEENEDTKRKHHYMNETSKRMFMEVEGQDSRNQISSNDLQPSVRHSQRRSSSQRDVNKSSSFDNVEQQRCEVKGSDISRPLHTMSPKRRNSRSDDPLMSLMNRRQKRRME